MADTDLDADGFALVAPTAAAVARRSGASDSSDDDRPLSTLRPSQWTAMKRAGKPKLKVTATMAQMRDRGQVPPSSASKKTKKKKKKSRPPTPPMMTSGGGGMLSVFELCNSDDERSALAVGGPHDSGRHRTQSFDSDATLGSEADAGSRKSADDDDTTSTVDGDNGSDLDEGWSDHNRWYCNICKVRCHYSEPVEWVGMREWTRSHTTTD